MSYYFLRQEKKIPSVFAYIFIFIVVLSLGFVLNKQQSFQTNIRASKNIQPYNIVISNITNTSASISFYTKDKTSALIKYATTPDLQQIKFDDRDLKNQAAYKIHYFTLSNLSPGTNYFFAIVIEGKEFNKNGAFYRLQTTNVNPPSSSHPPIFGKVVDTGLKPLENVLIELTIPKIDSSVKFTTLTKSSGEWIVTFPIILDNSFKPVSLQEDDVFVIKLTDSNFLSSKVTVYYKDASPLKTLVLGQNYDLVNGDAAVLGAEVNRNSLILSPRNNSIINSQYPTFRGLSSPNSLLELSLKPNAGSSVITTDKLGEWKYEVKNPLSPGKYTLTVKEQPSGKQQTIYFTIGKSGESVLGEATPSATLAPTMSPTPTITPFPSATLVPTRLPTPVPTVIQNQIPIVGTNNNLLILSASALSLLGLLLVLY